MPTTTLGFRYPSSTNTVNVPQDIQNLASDVDTYATTVNTFITRKENVQAVVSITASSAIGTTNTAILTLTNCLFQAGRAYSVECIGGVFGDADGRMADFGFFKTSTAGTQYGAFYRTRALIFQTNCYGKIYVIRSAGTDLTTDVVLTVNSNAGTVTHDAASYRPRALVVRDVGTAAQYSSFFAVT